MADEPSPTSDNDLMARLELLTSEGHGVSCRDFECMITKDEHTSMTLSELRNLFEFACDQLGHWETEWLFSFADSPNSVANTEREGWTVLRRAFFDLLVREIPDLRESLDSLQRRILLQHSLERRVEYNEGKPWRQISSIVMSKVSFLFDSLGFRRIAFDLYARALYPKGTVARP
jgi:hypothetical protein